MTFPLVTLENFVLSTWIYMLAMHFQVYALSNVDGDTAISSRRYKNSLGRFIEAPNVIFGNKSADSLASEAPINGILTMGRTYILRKI